MITGLVSVVLPVYNAEKFIEEAVASILRQSYGNLELIAIDDGSKDSSSKILQSFRDPRIRLMPNDSNLGLIQTLNKGFAVCRGEFIARMDADDISHPRRLELQVDHLRENPSLAGVSCRPHQLAEDGRTFHRSHLFEPTTRAAIQFTMAFENPLLHPGMVLRRKEMEGFQFCAEPQAKHVEDYELWSRLLQSGLRLESLPEPLLLFRMNAGSVTRLHKEEQQRNHNNVAISYAAASLGRIPSDRCIELMHYPKEIRGPGLSEVASEAFALRVLFMQKHMPDADSVAQIDRWMSRKLFLAWASAARRCRLRDTAALLSAHLTLARIGSQNPFRFVSHLVRLVLDGARAIPTRLFA